MNNDLIVDTILLAMKHRIKTETEVVEECGDLAMHGMLDWDYLYGKNKSLWWKVEEWCTTDQPELGRPTL